VKFLDKEPDTAFWEVMKLSGLIANKQTNSVSPPNYRYRGSFLNVKIGQFQKNGFRKTVESEFRNRSLLQSVYLKPENRLIVTELSL
jgi:hypothetical protein